MESDHINTNVKSKIHVNNHLNRNENEVDQLFDPESNIDEPEENNQSEKKSDNESIYLTEDEALGIEEYSDLGKYEYDDDVREELMKDEKSGTDSDRYSEDRHGASQEYLKSRLRDCMLDDAQHGGNLIIL